MGNALKIALNAVIQMNAKNVKLVTVLLPMKKENLQTNVANVQKDAKHALQITQNVNHVKMGMAYMFIIPEIPDAIYVNLPVKFVYLIINNVHCAKMDMDLILIQKKDPQANAKNVQPIAKSATKTTKFAKLAKTDIVCILDYARSAKATV